MISRGLNTSESWRTLPWKKFRRNLFRLQRRVYQAVQVGDKRKARSLQKLILKSQAARLLAIRQVTQLCKRYQQTSNRIRYREVFRQDFTHLNYG